MSNTNGLSEFDFDLSGFGNITCDEEEQPDTTPMAGSAQLEVEDKCEALFLTADWSVVARVNGVELGRSTAIGKAHSDPFMKRWTRQFIRQNRERLRRLGVDVSATYVQWGGLLDDLND